MLSVHPSVAVQGGLLLRPHPRQVRHRILLKPWLGRKPYAGLLHQRRGRGLTAGLARRESVEHESRQPHGGGDDQHQDSGQDRNPPDVHVARFVGRLAAAGRRAVIHGQDREPPSGTGREPAAAAHRPGSARKTPATGRRPRLAPPDPSSSPPSRCPPRKERPSSTDRPAASRARAPPPSAAGRTTASGCATGAGGTAGRSATGSPRARSIPSRRAGGAGTRGSPREGCPTR